MRTLDPEQHVAPIVVLVIESTAAESMWRKGIHLRPMNKNSKFYKFLRNIDCFVFVNRGLIPDLERLDFVREEQKFFQTKD